MAELDITWGLIIGLTSGTIMGFSIGKTFEESRYSPSKVQAIQQDYNKDGIPDALIISVSGRKIPMYGIQIGDGILYFSGKEMKTKDPESIIDYERIEDLLNKTPNP